MKKHWIFVLHSHLPFVKHPEYEDFLEEWWLFEAINETYIPLLMALKKLEDEGVFFRLTTSLTPSLVEMLSDRHLMDKYEKHLNKLIELGDKELIRTRVNYDEYLLAKFYKNRFTQIKHFFNGFLHKDILSGYRYFNKKGYLEIITSAATHAFLPFVKNRDFVRLQIEIGKKVHIDKIKKEPKGIWLPECAYKSGIGSILKEYGLGFFFTESHALCRDFAIFNGVYLFKRDNTTAKVVWSSKEGYPGDASYRDFYRDLGYDMPFYYIKDYLPGGIRTFTGYKYYSITGNTNQKVYYNPNKAFEKSKEHAYNFHYNLEKNLHHKVQNNQNLVTSFYDAELFGHWWFEGIDFIYNLFKVIDRYKEILPTTPSEYIESQNSFYECEPKNASWGDKGYYDVWLNGQNSWIYNHLHHAEDRLIAIFNSQLKKDREIVEQMIRELLLAQSSDWAFLITAKDNKQYAEHRQKEHIYNFNRLDEMLKSGLTDRQFLNKLKSKNSIFSSIDLYETFNRLRRNIH
jgi:1,4-alpha-glucan branching enzyme